MSGFRTLIWGLTFDEQDLVILRPIGGGGGQFLF